VLAGLPTSTLAPFQRVLHAAARIVMDLKPRDRVTPALEELHRLPVLERIQYKLYLVIHKSILGYTPDYISDLLRRVADISAHLHFVVWRPRCVMNTSTVGRRIGDRAFCVAALRAAWRSGSVVGPDQRG